VVALGVSDGIEGGCCRNELEKRFLIIITDQLKKGGKKGPEDRTH